MKVTKQVIEQSEASPHVLRCCICDEPIDRAVVVIESPEEIQVGLVFYCDVDRMVAGRCEPCGHEAPVLTPVCWYVSGVTDGWIHT